MVTDALSSYRPLQYTSSMFDAAINAIDHKERTWADTAIQVGEVVLRFLALIPLFFFDGLMTTASILYYNFFLEREVEEIEPQVEYPDSEPGEIEIPVLQPQQPAPQLQQPVVRGPIERIMDAEEIVLIGDIPIPQRTMDALLTRTGTEPGRYENVEYMHFAVENGLKVLPIASRRIFLEMILNDGVVIDGDAPVEIFSWMATSLIVQYLMARFHGRAPFPATPLPEANDQPATEANRVNREQHIDTSRRVTQCRGRFGVLSRPEKAALIHRLLCPTSELATTHRVRELLDEVNHCAALTHRDGEYNRRILFPFLRQFKNFIEESGVLDQ